MFQNDPIEIPLSEGDINLSKRRREWSATHIDDTTRRCLADDERYFLRQSLSTPCLDALVAADGVYIEDMQGRRYLDFHGNNVHQVGYRNSRVIEAVKKQLDTLPFCPRRYTNEPAIELARRLVDLAPGRLSRVLLAPGGAEAISVALKIARQKTGRYKTLSLWDSFHGATLDTISIGGESLFRSGMGPLMPGSEHAPPYNPGDCLFGCKGRCELRCANYIDYILQKEGDIGAVIAEPIRSTIVNMPPPEYWRRIRDICDRHGALLIFDEIPTCLGRTGRIFASETVGTTPDILVIGKGLGGAVMPIAAVIARDDLDIAYDRALGHYTHEKSPLGAVAALATLDCIEEDNLLENSREMGKYAMSRLRTLRQASPIVGDVRGVGLLIGVELTTRSGQPANEEADAILYAALAEGLNFKVSGGNVLTLTPPLTISRAEMERALSILERCILQTGGRFVVPPVAAGARQ